MKQFFKKAGYVSLEIIIAGAILILLGVIAITVLAVKEHQTANKSLDEIDAAMKLNN